MRHALMDKYLPILKESQTQIYEDQFSSSDVEEELRQI